MGDGIADLLDKGGRDAADPRTTARLVPYSVATKSLNFIEYFALAGETAGGAGRRGRQIEGPWSVCLTVTRSGPLLKRGPFSYTL